MDAQKSKFIVLEGIDGSGKSTLSRKIKAKFDEINSPVFSTREPNDSEIGKLIRDILTHQREGDERLIASLFLADRVDHLTHSAYGILQFLNKGTHVLSDRYYLSSYAYHVPYVSLDWVIEANSICAAMKKADITFFIDISVEESLRRIAARNNNIDRFENEMRITQVRNNYLDAIDKVKQEENIIIINGEQSPEKVFEEVWENIKLII